MNKEKQNARYTARRLLEQGRLLRKDVCEKCGDKPKPFIRVNGRKQSRLEMHHPDHTKPAEVVWLCTKCHLAFHAQEKSTNATSVIENN